MKKIITISTGTEIMLGHVADQDFHWIAERLSQMGCPVYRHYGAGDDSDELSKILSEALGLADAVILTGGLGPTTDDLTREVASKVLRRPLLVNTSVLNGLEKKFKTRSLPMPECVRRQALILEGARVIENKFGTAPGMIFKQNGKLLFLLPGPPYEMKPMLERNVLPRIKKLFGGGWYRFLKIRTFGLAESGIQEMLAQALKDAPDRLKRIGYTSSPEGVDVRLDASATEWPGLKSAARRVQKILKPWTYGVNDETLPSRVVRLLMAQRKTLAVAESCTGGLVAQRLTGLAGASRVFRLGVVAYSNDSKMNLLGVSQSNLTPFGAVSKEVAIQMAKGVLEKAQAAIGLSITGIAGPTGGTKEKPIGLVWLGLHDGQRGKAESCRFSGNRQAIQFKASQAAFDMLRRSLTKGVF